MTYVLSVISGKGGAGKTTTSTNLALALKNFNQKVTLVDGNFTTPNVSLHLGMSLLPVTLHDVIRGNATMHQATYKHQSGIDVIPSSLSKEHLDTYRPKRFKKVLRELYNKKGIIVIDGAAGLGREARASMEVADGILVVTNPEMPAVTDALKAIKQARKSNRNILGVVLNRSNQHKKELGVSDVRDMLEVPIIGTIPEDPKVKESIYSKTPVVHFSPRSPSAKAFKKLAATLLEEEYYESVGFWELFSNLFKNRR